MAFVPSNQFSNLMRGHPIHSCMIRAALLPRCRVTSPIAILGAALLGVCAGITEERLTQGFKIAKKACHMPFTFSFPAKHCAPKQARNGQFPKTIAQCQKA